MRWREIGPYLRELWQRPAGPMNWKNPIRVFAVLGWLVVQGFVLLGWAGFRVFQGFLLLGWVVFRAGQIVLGLPPLLLFFFAAVGWAGWSFVHRPFPPLDEHPILVLVEYHTPNFFDALVVWYYVTPFAVVMLTGFISVTIWRVWLEGRRSDFASFSKLPPWPLDPKQKAPAIVIGEVHHPVEAREVFNPSWLTIPERGLYTGVAIFGAVGSGKTSACMNPFARQLLGWQAGDEQKRAAALVLEVKGDFCHDIRQILVEAGRGQDYIELGMDARSQWNPLSAWWLDSYSLAYTVSSLLNQLFGKGKEPFWQQAYTNLVRWIIELFRVFPERWVTLQQVYRCAIDPELFAAKIEEAEKLSDDLNTGTVFVARNIYQAQLINLAEWNWTNAPETKEQNRLHAPAEREARQAQDHPSDRLGTRTRRRHERARGGRQALVCPRLANPGQQDQVFDCGGGFSVPCHVRYAGRGEGVLSRRAAYPLTILKPLSCKPQSNGPRRRRTRRRRRRRSAEGGASARRRRSEHMGRPRRTRSAEAAPDANTPDPAPWELVQTRPRD